MIIKQDIPLGTIIRRTGPDSIHIALVCVGAFFVYRYLVTDFFTLPTVVPSLMGAALAFFIGFSNSSAYDRWWEARSVWGTINNESRSWARACLIYVRPEDGDRAVERMVLRQIAFVYELKAWLRRASGEPSVAEYRPYLDPAEFDRLQLKGNKHNALLDEHSRDLQDLYAAGRVNGFQFVEMNRRVTALCDEMGKCERIANTVFPPTYNYYTRMFVWVFIVCVSFVMADAVGAYGIIPAFVLGYVFLVSQGIAMTLLNPFEQVEAGTPLDQITRGIEITLLEMLGRTDLPEPFPSVKGVYVT